MEQAYTPSLPPLCRAIMDHWLSGKFNPGQMKIACYFLRKGYVAPHFMTADEWKSLVAAQRLGSGTEWMRKCRTDLWSLGLLLRDSRDNSSGFALNPEWKTPFTDWDTIQTGEPQ